MKQSKQIFACIAAIVILTCILAVVFLGGNDEPGTTDPIISTTAPAADGTQNSEPSTQPIQTEENDDNYAETYIPEMGVSGIRNIYELADNVTITQVPKDPNEVIHAFEPIGPDDPEYLPNSDENYDTVEGKVFRNDKVISIELLDEYSGKDMTISFGYITGELNRFLYLNPVVETSDSNPKYGFYFNVMPAGGNVLTLPASYSDTEALSKAKRNAHSFHVGRALDQNDIATYQDPTHPGTIWFTQTPIDTDLWVDVLVYQMGGDMLATLRLTIAKDPDGTYSIVNLENKNLLQTYEQEGSQFTKEEMAYLYNLGKTTVEDPDIVKFDAASSEELTIERFIIELRNENTGLYYPYFVPADQSGGYYARSQDYSYGPVIAISVRQAGMMATAVTMYFRILKSPSESDHGIYEYIGRDFLFYQSSQALYNQGYPGM